MAKVFGKRKSRPGKWRKVWHPDGTTTEWEEVSPKGRFTEINSEPVICKRGGETLDFGVGDVVEVSDSYEKARELRKRGLMPSPGNKHSKRRPDPPKLEDFKDYWQRTTGRPFEEVQQHMRIVPRR